MGAVQLPMMGQWRVRVLGARPFTIHGDEYYELVIERTTTPGQQLAVRVSGHAVGPGVLDGSGDPVEVEMTFLMGQVTAIKRVTPT